MHCFAYFPYLNGSLAQADTDAKSLPTQTKVVEQSNMQDYKMLSNYL